MKFRYLILNLGCINSLINIGQDQLERAQRVWEKRCRLVCFCAQTESDGQTYSDLGALFASVFLNMGTVPSDIAAGLVLVHRQQEDSQLFAEIKVTHD